MLFLYNRSKPRFSVAEKRWRCKSKLRQPGSPTPPLDENTRAAEKSRVPGWRARRRKEAGRTHVTSRHIAILEAILQRNVIPARRAFCRRCFCRTKLRMRKCARECVASLCCVGCGSLRRSCSLGRRLRDLGAFRSDVAPHSECLADRAHLRRWAESSVHTAAPKSSGTPPGIRDIFPRGPLRACLSRTGA